jgi:hypothetical protein
VTDVKESNWLAESYLGALIGWGGGGVAKSFCNWESWAVMGKFVVICLPSPQKNQQETGRLANWLFSSFKCFLVSAFYVASVQHASCLLMHWQT